MTLALVDTSDRNHQTKHVCALSCLKSISPVTDAGACIRLPDLSWHSGTHPQPDEEPLCRALTIPPVDLCVRPVDVRQHGATGVTATPSVTAVPGLSALKGL